MKSFFISLLPYTVHGTTLRSYVHSRVLPYTGPLMMRHAHYGIAPGKSIGDIRTESGIFGIVAIDRHAIDAVYRFRTKKL